MPIAIPADNVVGCYKLHRRLGGGAFGEVWVGSHCLLGGYYAVKVVPANGLGAIEREGVGRYKNLANGHPGLVPINDFGEVEGLCYYYGMPLADDVKGPAPLRDPNQYEPLTLERYWKLHKPLPLDTVLTVGRHLLRALQDLHDAALVHRDVKLGNVVRMDGVWKLTDVSLLIRRDEITTNSGTPWFVPPEGNKDRRADLFALGKILFLLATDLPRSDFEDFMQERQTIPGTDDRRASLQKIIKCACQDDPNKRYQTAAEMRQAFDPLIKPVSITVVLDEDICSFTAERRREFIEKLRRQGYNVSGDPRFEPGSVRVTLQLMPDEAERLAAAVRAGEFAEFHAVAVEMAEPAFPHLPTATRGRMATTHASRSMMEQGSSVLEPRTHAASDIYRSVIHDSRLEKSPREVPTHMTAAVQNESIKIERHGDIAVITPSSEVERMPENMMEQAAQLVLATLRSDPPAGLVFDLSQVDYVGSVFLSFLLRCHKRIKEKGCEVVLAGASPRARELLHMTALDALWALYDSRAQALAALGD
jgi:anti-anti-sigma factor